MKNNKIILEYTDPDGKYTLQIDCKMATDKKELTNYLEVSETDSEVVAALIDKLYSEEKDMIKVLSKLKDLLVGTDANLGILQRVENIKRTIVKDTAFDKHRR